MEVVIRDNRWNIKLINKIREIYMKIVVKVNGKDIVEMTEKEKKEVSNALNRQALLTSGYIEIKKKERVL